MNQNYFNFVDHQELIRQFPTGPEFIAKYNGMSSDELRNIQNGLFSNVMAFAWKVPFYQRLWQSKGIEPSDIKNLDDITKLPVYSKSDLMASVELYPPIGDFHGMQTYPKNKRPPLIFQTTSGTTGKPQPLLFGPKSREVQSLLLGRLYALQGFSNEDVVHSVYGHGMVNGGHYVREAINHWLGAQMLTAGTGVETRSENQIAMMYGFKATAIVGFGDFIKRLATVAREKGLEPGIDIPIKKISGHMGAESKASMSEAWGGAEVYDWYGVGDTGAIAGEGPDHSGLHILEDAQFIELLDIDTADPVAEGAIGDMVCTCLFKDDIFPIIRFKTHDVSREVEGTNPLGLPFRRLEGFLGRSDNMVKLRGINIYPQSIGSILTEAFTVATGEFICRVRREDGREEMTAVIEATRQENELKEAMEATLRSRLGVGISVQLVKPGETADLSGIETRQKPVRLIDER